MEMCGAQACAHGCHGPVPYWTLLIRYLTLHATIIRYLSLTRDVTSLEGAIRALRLASQRQ